MGEFTESELTIIRTALGSLPAQPGPDPSNRHADSDAAAALGHKLFFDARYSSDGSVSCATCHDPASGFTDARANTSAGVAGITGRRAPTIINSAHGRGTPGAPIWQFWDGRKDSLWSQALGPPENPVEMGSTRTRVALLIYDEYQAEYEWTFGPMPPLRDQGGAAVAPDSAMPGTAAWDALDPEQQDAITAIYVNFGKSIAAYEARLNSRGSAFDEFWQEIADGAPDSDVLTPEQKLGLKVFIGKGRCVSCHRGPNFTDCDFHNIAIEQSGPNLPALDQGRFASITTVLLDEFNCASDWSDREDKAACGVRAGITASVGELGAFKTPGLRDVSTRRPYFHTGMFDTLEQVVDHYDRGGATGGFVGTPDRDVRSLHLTTVERAALVAFMVALEGEPLEPYLLSAP